MLPDLLNFKQYKNNRLNIRTCVTINNQNHEMKICEREKKGDGCERRQKMFSRRSIKVWAGNLTEEQVWDFLLRNEPETKASNIQFMKRSVKCKQSSCGSNANIQNNGRDRNYSWITAAAAVALVWYLRLDCWCFNRISAGAGKYCSCTQ